MRLDRDPEEAQAGSEVIRRALEVRVTEVSRSGPPSANEMSVLPTIRPEPVNERIGLLAIVDAQALDRALVTFLLIRGTDSDCGREIAREVQSLRSAAGPQNKIVRGAICQP